MFILTVEQGIIAKKRCIRGRPSEGMPVRKCHFIDCGSIFSLFIYIIAVRFFRPTNDERAAQTWYPGPQT
jgi:hypothetical protein